MKKLYIITSVLLLQLLWGSSILAQVGMTGNNPASSAELDLRADNPGNANKGLLIPQVSLTNVTSGLPIVSGTPATSLLVFNTNASITGGSGTGYYYWDGTKWQRMIIATSGNRPDNLGNHTATQTLDMTNFNINSINKLSTTTTAIAKGIDGNTAQSGNLLTAGDAAGNTNWVMPIFPRTFYWKDGSLASSTGTPLSVAPGASAIVPEFSGKSYTAPADGVLEVGYVMYASCTYFNNFSSVNGLYTYINVSVTLQPLENGNPITGSAIKGATSPSQAFTPASGTIVAVRDCLWLTTKFRVTKGAVYTFRITFSNDAQTPGVDPAGYLQALYGGLGSRNAISTMSGVLYVDP